MGFVYIFGGKVAYILVWGQLGQQDVGRPVFLLVVRLMTVGSVL